MQHEHHRVPVTALAFSRNVILAGEGNYLCAYSQDSRPLTRTCIFTNQAIHGIVVNEGDTSVAFVYGGPLFRIIWLDHGEVLNIDLPSLTQDVGDWILDACFTPTLEEPARRHISLITAHNALYVACLGGGPAKATSTPSASLECLVSRSNCILYSAHIFWLNPSRCLVASGTAFGDIIVWSAFVSENDGVISACSQIHSTFAAHEGSVFGVHISPLVKLHGSDEYSRVLASCSDDRNIRLWDITDVTVDPPTPAKVQRSTGFGPSDRMADAAPPLLAKIMGHISRIWQVKFVIAATFELNQIRSFGEDASVIAWNLKQIRGSSNFALEKVDVMTGHSGKNIWSVAMDDSGYLATGGADGAIVLFSNSCRTERQMDIQGTSKGESQKTENLRAYGFVDANSLVATTDQGPIVQIDFDQDHESGNVTTIEDDLTNLRGFSLVATTPRLALIASVEGIVYGYLPGSDTVEQIPSHRCDGKPAGLFVYQISEERAAYLQTTVGSPNAVMKLGSAYNAPIFRKSLERSWILPPGFIVTSFATRIERLWAHVILGSRTGSIAIYDLFKTHLVNGCFIDIPAAKTFDLVHGREAITDLHIVIKDGKEQQYCLFSTGRDGTFAVHRISNFGNAIQFVTVHQLALPFGPNIEGVHVSTTGELPVWGFKSKHFIVYDVLKQRETMSVECGGAHRTWTFHPLPVGGTFVWTKASKVYRKTQTELPYQLMRAGGHGREIKSTAVSPSEPQIIATGAEDTDIKLHRLDNGTFKYLHTLRKHNTGVQCLQWSSDGRYLFSSGGFEEFFAWHIYTNVPHLGTGVVCESRHPSSGTSDLRIMGFDVHEAPRTAHAGPAQFEILMVYSDSTAKFWSYQAGEWDLLASGDYITACLNHTMWMKDSSLPFVTVATDGHIADWQIDPCNATVRWEARHKIHQSAIHAIATRKLAGGSTIMITGGDDNAVGITRIDSWAQERKMQTTIIPRAHAAAVTGIVVVPLGESTCWVVTASIDQRVKLWQLSIDPSQPGIDGVDVKLLQNVYTSVADVASLDLCTLEDGAMGVIVSGVGMDVWRLPSRTANDTGT